MKEVLRCQLTSSVSHASERIFFKGLSVTHIRIAGRLQVILFDKSLNRTDADRCRDERRSTHIWEIWNNAKVVSKRATECNVSVSGTDRETDGASESGR